MVPVPPKASLGWLAALLANNCREGRGEAGASVCPAALVRGAVLDAGGVLSIVSGGIASSRLWGLVRAGAALTWVREPG